MKTKTKSSFQNHVRESALKMIVEGQEAAESLFNHQSLRQEEEETASVGLREEKGKSKDEEKIECREEAVGLCL